MKLIASEFGPRIQSMRKRQNLTQRQLAVMVGTSERVIQHYELGESLPGSDKLVALADALDVSLDELVGREHRSREKHSSDE